MIHNGIIENYHELEMELSSARKHPISQTDSEIVAMLIDSLYDGDAFHAIREAVKNWKALMLSAYCFQRNRVQFIVSEMQVL